MRIEVARPSEDLLPVRVVIGPPSYAALGAPDGDVLVRPDLRDIRTWGRFLVDEAEARRFAESAPGLAFEVGDFVIADQAGAPQPVSVRNADENSGLHQRLGLGLQRIFQAGASDALGMALGHEDQGGARCFGILALREGLADDEGPEAEAWRENFNRWADWAVNHADVFGLADQRELTVLAMTRDPAAITPQVRVAMERAPRDAAYRGLLAEVASMRRDVANLVAPFARIDRPMRENIEVVREVMPDVADAFAPGGVWRAAVTRPGASAAKQSNDALVRELFAQVTLQAPESILASSLPRHADAQVTEIFDRLKEAEEIDPAWADAAQRNLHQTLAASGILRTGYRADIDFAATNGMAFMKVADPHSTAIYAWPQDALRPLADIEGRLALPVEPIERSDAQIERLRAVRMVLGEQRAIVEGDEAAPVMPAAEILRQADERIARLQDLRAQAEARGERFYGGIEVLGVAEADEDDDDFDNEDEDDLDDDVDRAPAPDVAARADDGPFAMRPPAPGRQAD